MIFLDQVVAIFSCHFVNLFIAIISCDFWNQVLVIMSCDFVNLLIAIMSCHFVNLVISIMSCDYFDQVVAIISRDFLNLFMYRSSSRYFYLPPDVYWDFFFHNLYFFQIQSVEIFLLCSFISGVIIFNWKETMFCIT